MNLAAQSQSVGRASRSFWVPWAGHRAYRQCIVNHSPATVRPLCVALLSNRAQIITNTSALFTQRSLSVWLQLQTKEMEKVHTWFCCAQNNRLLSLSSRHPFDHLVYLGKSAHLVWYTQNEIRLYTYGITFPTESRQTRWVPFVLPGTLYTTVDSGRQKATLSRTDKYNLIDNNPPLMPHGQWLHWPSKNYVDRSAGLAELLRLNYSKSQMLYLFYYHLEII